MTTQVVATGLTGTIGRHLQRHVVDLNIRLGESVDHIQPSLDNNIVIHLAAVVGEQHVRRDLTYSYKVNVTGALELARVTQRSKALRFVYVSTSHVYERSQELKLLDESSTVLPQGQYALQKLLAEELICDIFRSDPSRLVIARVFSVLHPTQPGGTLGHSIGELLQDESRLLKCADDERDFLSPQVIARALNSLAASKNAVGKVNVCSGKPLTIREAVRCVVGDRIYERIRYQLIAGQSPNPRIVGSPRRLEHLIGVPSSELIENSVNDWKAARTTSE